MNDSENYQISYSSTFIASYKQLKKSHFGKDSKGITELEGFIEAIVSLLSYEPEPPIDVARRYNDTIKDIAPQKFNSKKYLSHWEFRKLYFSISRLKGTASMGRLMYVIDKSRKTVYFLYIYTHQQHENRPSDGTMNKLFENLKTESYND